jgi:hypothetical protein
VRATSVKTSSVPLAGFGSDVIVILPGMGALNVRGSQTLLDELRDFHALLARESFGLFVDGLAIGLERQDE